MNLLKCRRCKKFLSRFESLRFHYGNSGTVCFKCYKELEREELNRKLLQAGIFKDRN